MIPSTLPDGSPDPALLVDGTLDAFKTALAGHRAYARETDPPMV
jgi:catalase